MIMEFPVMLLKIGNMFQWDGGFYDYTMCADQEEYDIAILDGWCMGKPVAKPVVEVDVSDDGQAPKEPARRGRPPKIEG
jgi:hypothetical protein